MRPAAETRLTLTGKELKELLTRTQFAMAQQDVRYYLNGLLLEIRANRVRTSSLPTVTVWPWPSCAATPGRRRICR